MENQLQFILYLAEENEEYDYAATKDQNTTTTITTCY
jgi:hypothetical protein